MLVGKPPKLWLFFIHRVVRLIVKKLVVWLTSNVSQFEFIVLIAIIYIIIKRIKYIIQLYHLLFMLFLLRWYNIIPLDNILTLWSLFQIIVFWLHKKNIRLLFLKSTHFFKLKFLNNFDVVIKDIFEVFNDFNLFHLHLFRFSKKLKHTLRDKYCKWILRDAQLSAFVKNVLCMIRLSLIWSMWILDCLEK